MIIAFAQQKGGAGKTTVLAHLAHAWADRGRSVGLADLDPQRSLALWTANQRDHDYRVIESAGWRAASDIRDLSRVCDVTLIDCPGNASSLLEAALRAADLVVLPCQPSMLDAWATEPILQMAAREKTPARVLMNRMPPRGGIADQVQKHLQDAGAELFRTSLGNRVAFASGIGRGTTALGLSRTSRATREVAALADEIEALLAGP